MESTQGATPVVRFTNVQKSFDGVTLVIKDLNLDIQQGEFLTLLGPSGSGKLTMMMVIDVTVIIPAIGAAGTWHTLG